MAQDANARLAYHHLLLTDQVANARFVCPGVAAEEWYCGQAGGQEWSCGQLAHSAGSARLQGKGV